MPDEDQQATPPTPPKVPAVVPPEPPRRETKVVLSDILLLDTAKFEQMQRIAGVMAEASILPDHLVAQPFWWRKNMAPGDIADLRAKMSEEAWNRSWVDAKKRTVANCFLVVEQSFRWGMSPFAVAPETYVVGGKLAYQGKLVLAVVNELAGLESRLRFQWAGEGTERQITISGRFRGESVDREDTVVWSKVKTDNQAWTKDPDQKLLYTGILHWARRWCPEVVLGVKSREDVEQEAQDEVVVDLPPRRPAVSSLDAFAGVSGAAPAPAALAAGSMPIAVEIPAAAKKEEVPTAKLDPAPQKAADPGPEPAPVDARKAEPKAASSPAQKDPAPALFDPPPAVVSTGQPFLSDDHVGKLRALILQAPAVGEVSVSRVLDNVPGETPGVRGQLGAESFEEVTGHEGETADELYSRAVAAVSEMKKAKGRKS